MQKTILTKITAILLLLVLILPIFGNTAYAVAEEVAVNQANLRTSTRFVDANLAFLRGEEALENVVADVSETNLKFRLFLNLKDEGYFKGGQIEIRNSENLTYEFVEPEKKSDLIQSVEGQIIKLNQIKGVSETYLEVPIRYVGVDNVDSKKLINKNDFELTGEYTNAQGRKYDVYKRSTLTLNWIDNKKIEVSNKVQKFIKYEIGKTKTVILQNLITVKNVNEEIILPTKNIVIETNLLKLKDKLPKSVNVSIQKASLFNDEENIILDKDIYSWDIDKNLLKIEVENAKNKDDTYSAGKGDFEVLVTTIYEVDEFLNKYEGDMEIKVRQYVLSGNEKQTENIKDLKSHLVFDKEIGKLIDINEETDIKQIAKGILYTNLKSTNIKDNIVKSKLKLDVSNIDVVDSIKVIENEPQYNNGIKENNFIYKSIEINKKEFDHVFKDGYIDIYSNGKLINKIDNNTLEKNQKYIIEFKEKVSNISIQTSKPVKEGEVFIEYTRTLNKPSYDINVLKDLNSLDINKTSYIVLNNEEKQLNQLNSTIKLVNASSNIIVNTNRKELSTIKKNENVEFVIALNNDKIISDVYGQSVFEIVLPNGIKDIQLKNSNLIHGEGLKISSARIVKKGLQYVIQIVLIGTQNGLSTGHLTNGTNIIINTDITLDQWATSKDVKYNVTYSNSLATNYKNKVVWNMSDKFINFQKFGNGFIQGDFKFVAPKGLVLINEFNNYNKKNDSIISINQGYKEGKLDVLSGSRKVDGQIYLLNNSGQEVTEPTVLGRIPNKLNKNIFTNESLGSTFNTTLIKGIDSKDSNVTIYYSPNPNATNDLKNVNNAWTRTIQFKDARSYLIVLDKNLERGKLVKLDYQIEIPANLEHNNQVQTYSMVEYGINTKKGNERYYQMASPIGLSTGEGVRLNIDIKADKNKVVENEDIVYSLEVTNEAKKTEAKNVESYFRIPDNLEFKGIRDDATKTNVRLSENKKGVYITLGNIKVGKTVSKDLVFTAKKVKNEEPIELIVNTAADNFDIVKSKKALGNTVEAQKLSVLIEQTESKNDLTRVNIYPKQIKKYNITLTNNTGFSYNKEKLTATYGNVLGNIIITIPLPSSLEYAGEINPLYKVLEYNRVTNVLKLQLLDDTLPQGDSVKLELPLKLKEVLPADYNKVIKISATAATKTLDTKQDVSVQSNVLTNYIADKKLNAKTAVYNFDSDENKPLDDVQEYQDILIKYSIKPTFTVMNAQFVFEAPKGLKVSSIYKNETLGNTKTALTMGSQENSDDSKVVYTYPVYTPVNQTTDIYVHANVDGIGEASSKTLSYKIGLVGAEQTINLNVRKGAVQSSIKKMYEEEGLNLSPEDMKKYGLGASTDIVAKNSILGKTWIDSNKTGIQTGNDKAIGKVIVELVDNDTKRVVARTVSDDEGNYQFDNVVNGNYSAVFKYNDKTYIPTAYNVKSETDENSKGIGINTNNKSNTKVAVTDGIQVNFASVRNVDLGLVEKSNFDLSIDSEITEVQVIRPNKEIKKFNFNDRRTVKIELDRSALNNAKVQVKYLVRAINEGELEGNVLKINAYIPEGMRFIPELNKLWTLDENGNVFTTALAVNEVKPGQALELPLILEKDFNKDELGLSVLGLEIAEVKNNFGLPDRDSTPNNHNTDEDDYINVDLILGLNTGKKIAYVLLILTTLAVIGTTIFLVLRKINGKEIK